MLMAAVVYLRVACGYDNVPLLPAMTLLGSIGIAIIEVKSIYEKAEEKEQRNFDDAAHTLAQCLKMLKDKGIINKIGIIMCILLCRLIDLSGIIGSEHILPIVSFFFIMNESFSIMENLKQLNVPIPDFLATKLDNLKNMGKKNKK